MTDWYVKKNTIIFNPAINTNSVPMELLKNYTKAEKSTKNFPT